MFDLQDRCSATTRLVAKGVGADDFVCVNYQERLDVLSCRGEAMSYGWILEEFYLSSEANFKGSERNMEWVCLAVDVQILEEFE